MFDSIYYTPQTFERPAVHAKHPLRNREYARQLVDYLRPRWDAGRDVRDAQLTRMQDVDRIVSTWIRHTGEDALRLKQERETGEPQARKMNLPVVFTHLDDILSYYIQVFCPNRGMFFNSGNATEARASSELVKFMNHNALSAGYYREFLAAIWACLKYNTRGGLLMHWNVQYGQQISRDENGQVVQTPKLMWQGNRVEAIDPYNVLLDPSVPAHKIHCDGEYFTIVRMMSPFEIRRRAEKGEYFNVDEVGLQTEVESVPETVYWTAPPSTHENQNSGSSTFNWIRWMTGNTTSSTLGTSVREVLETYVWINPYYFNLIPQTRANLARNRPEIWKITTLGDEVIGASPTGDMHEHLPGYFGIIHDDSAPTEQKSIAELLEPLQSSASFCMNQHIKALRKNLFGTTFYDPTRVDYDSIPAGEVNARVKVKQAGYGQDVRTMVYHDNSPLDTRQTLQDVGDMIDLGQKFFPSQQLPSQIAGIDRAVNSQVAAVQHGANVRNQKNGRLLDETMFAPMRVDMYFNIVQRFESGVITDYDGSEINLNVSELQASDAQFVIGMGLKTLDRMYAASSMQQIIFAMIQAPQVGQQLPLMEMMEHWSRMIDLDLDLKQFVEAAKQQRAQMAAAQAAAAGGQGGITIDPTGKDVAPMQDPQSVTSAIMS